MRLSDIKGEKALEVLADILEPATEIFTDPAVEQAYRTKRRVDVAVVIIKNHPKAILRIMALLDGEDPKTYAPSLIELPKKVLELINDPALKDFFKSQGQRLDETSSGSAMENTEATEAE